jgi:aspartyl-tRNA(Asn)/glutamyl-tRNA(Gln) amidotransferase subunit B
MNGALDPDLPDSLVERYEIVVGLEVHAQLSTATKIFSSDSAAFGGDPNTHVDPVSLGHPGTLPVLNERAVRSAVAMGLATNCTVRPSSLFARKHYFYPDLPKGYQTSQFDEPICADGWVEVEADDGATRRARLNRIHLEEDAGKSVHDLDPEATLVDHNRCGVPLIEIVTEPDLRSPGEAYRFLAQIRQTVRYLGICDGNMEEGSLRCDANVSVRPVGSDALGTKTEVKNLNSLRNVERAIAYEAERHVRLLDAGQRVVQETRLWDAGRLETRGMRSKELAHDYRYMPDPDLPPVVVSEALLAEVRAALPEMPAARRARLAGALGLPPYDAQVLTEDRETADYFDAVLRALGGDAPTPAQAKAASNLIMTDVLRVLSERQAGIADFPVDAPRLAGLIRLRLDDRISSSGGAEVFEALLASDDDAEAIAEARHLFQVSDLSALVPVVEAVLAGSGPQVQQYLDGKTGVIGFLIGQVMKSFPGAADPQVVRALLTERLDAARAD